MLDLRTAPGFLVGLHLAFFVTGCPGSTGSETSTGSTGRETSTSSAGPETSTGPETPTTPTTSTTVFTTGQNSSSGSGEQPVTTTDADTGETTLGTSCGDGSVDAGEACDDGNQVNGDGCNVDCKPSAEMLWEYRSGLPNPDLFFDVAVTADGEIFAGGAQPVDGNFDRWLTRFSSDGDVVWSRTYAEAGSDWVINVAVSDTLIYAAGSTMTGPTTQAWIAGLDLDGEPLWSDDLSSNFGDAFASGVATTPEGDAVFTGLAPQQGGQTEVWTRRYGVDGGMQWSQSQVVTDTPMWPLGPAVSATMDRIIVGYYTAAPLSEMLLGYAPAGGEPLFDSAFTMNQAQILAAAQDLGGNIFTAGIDANSGLVVRRFASDASPAWSESKCEGAGAQSIAVDSQGDVVVIGYGTGPKNLGNIRLCKYSPEGDLRWGKDIDGGGDDAGYGVAIMADDRIVACGRMFTEDTNGDAWLAVFAP